MWKYSQEGFFSLKRNPNIKVVNITKLVFQAWFGYFAYVSYLPHGTKSIVLNQCLRFSSVQFSCSIVAESLQPHGLQHTRLPCPSPTPGTYSNSCPLSSWCHPTITSSVVPFSSCLQSFPAVGSFPVSQFFISGGKSIGVSASASILPMNTSSILKWLHREAGGGIRMRNTCKSMADSCLCMAKTTTIL